MKMGANCFNHVIACLIDSLVDYVGLYSFFAMQFPFFPSISLSSD